VAQFHQPKVQEQGYYQLKPELWKEFDPFFAKTMPSAALECVESCEYSCQGSKSCSNWQITQYYCFTDDGDSSVCVSVLVCHTFSYYHAVIK
jgi:hypothetical protein